MLSGTSIFCFTASYTVALALEGSRLFFRSGVRGAVLLAFGAAGFVAHTIFLAYRARAESMPLASEFDWYLVAAWFLAAIYLYLTLHFPRTAVGLFTLPLVLALVTVAAKFANRQPFPRTQASQFWGTIHGAFLLLGTVAVLVGFVAGVMHLMQSYRLKHKLPVTQGFQLPSLEWLERANSRATVTSAMALAIGFLSGWLLNLVNRSEHPGESLPWSDPVVWSSGLLLVWMMAAALFSLVYRPARQGRKVAYLTVASFLFLVAVLTVQLAAPSRHGTKVESREKVQSPKSKVQSPKLEGFRSRPGLPWAVGSHEESLAQRNGAAPSLDFGLWTFDFGLSTWNFGLWTFDFRLGDCA